MLKKILVASDLSSTSYNLIECLTAFKNFGCKEIVLLHVIDLKYAVTVPDFTIEETERLLQNQAEILTKFDIIVKTEIRNGIPWSEILESAKANDVSAVVVGSHGRSTAAEIILGSVTSELIEQANLPLCVIRMSEYDTAKKSRSCATKLEHLFDNVLFTTDFSEENKAAIHFLKNMKDLIKKITIVHVQEPILLEQPIEIDLEALDAIDLNRLEDVRKEIGIEKALTNLEILHGKPSLEIVDFIKLGKFTLVVMGTRGLGLAARMLLGSNSRYVIRHAGIPVMIIPQK